MREFCGWYLIFLPFIILTAKKLKILTRVFSNSSQNLSTKFSNFQSSNVDDETSVADDFVFQQFFRSVDVMLLYYSCSTLREKNLVCERSKKFLIIIVISIISWMNIEKYVWLYTQRRDGDKNQTRKTCDFSTILWTDFLCDHLLAAAGLFLLSHPVLMWQSSHFVTAARIFFSISRLCQPFNCVWCLCLWWWWLQQSLTTKHMIVMVEMRGKCIYESELLSTLGKFRKQKWSFHTFLLTLCALESSWVGERLCGE